MYGIVLWLGATALPADLPERPNFIVVLCDNLGYGDLGCYGATVHRTPHVDRLAREGLRLTSFYASSGVCTPSRASLLTGCYAQRIGMHVSDRGHAVLQPVAARGLHPDELTIAEVLRPRGYATAIIGKWHLGDQPQFLPTRQGFDAYFGIPYSDDMAPRLGQAWPPLPLMRDERVIEAPADRNELTRRYTDEALKFIEAHRGQPFFLYLAQAMPGSTDRPFASEAFRGKSANGPYGDSVEELDWSLGEVLARLARLELDRRTVVIFTSDNGPPRREPPQGRVGPLRGWGYSTSEGAMRVPCVVRWTGRTPAGRACDELCTTMDFLPTLARLAGAHPPADRVIDGRDIGPLWLGQPDAKSPHEAFYYYFMDQLQAVRSGSWKLYLPLAARRGMGRQSPPASAALYDLAADRGETRNVIAEHPAVVARLTALAERARNDLGDVGRPGRNVRPAGSEPHPTPRELPPENATR